MRSHDSKFVPWRTLRALLMIVSLIDFGCVRSKFQGVQVLPRRRTSSPSLRVCLLYAVIDEASDGAGDASEESKITYHLRGSRPVDTRRPGVSAVWPQNLVLTNVGDISPDCREQISASPL